MLCALALLAVAFPDSPLVDQVALGRALAAKEPRLQLADLFRAPEPRTSISRIWGKDRQVIGDWSNGYVKVPVEHVVWVSPSLVSRWLGFLSEREHWEDGDLGARWNGIAALIGQKRMFVVQLTAFPKMPTYGVSDYERTSPEEIENVRFVYTSGEKVVRMQAERIAQRQSRDRRALEDFPWWHQVSFGEFLTGEFEQTHAEPPLPLGDYHRAWYLVSVEGFEDAKFEVRVLSRRKERVARFSASK